MAGSGSTRYQLVDFFYLLDWLENAVCSGIPKIILQNFTVKDVLNFYV